MKSSTIKIINSGVASIFIILLIILACLKPEPGGFGTHMQLIPVPCLFKQVLRVPCPSCGLTTSISCLMHGRFADSIRAHPLGPAFLILFVIITISSIYGIIRGKAWWHTFEKRWFQNAVIYGIGLYLGVWIIRLIFLLFGKE